MKQAGRFVGVPPLTLRCLRDSEQGTGMIPYLRPKGPQKPTYCDICTMADLIAQLQNRQAVRHMTSRPRYRLKSVLQQIGINPQTGIRFR
ncbi:MAG: hypothetical protein JWM11_1031 [Planctomycetaceae bacterium]|nr:hypothetical protein [Planctomycetaceae bacterium]